MNKTMLDWTTSKTDANGVTTLYPSQPAEWNQIPKCNLCGGLTQFLHFWPEVLQLLDDEELVPSFCSEVCAREFVRRKQDQT